ncbi:MAG: hypothetical protein L3K14_00845 [Thermoplasmata archaeon]|nr:hypothetical protein [Thermoplasmata archaeon]
MPTSPAEAPWGTCTFCGDAVPPDGNSCPTCGKVSTAPLGLEPARSRPVRRRLLLLQSLRVFVVVAVIASIGWAIISAELSGPTTFPDPLTGVRTLTVTPGGWAFFAGNITGEDYITGNFSVVTPPGGNVTVWVYNASEFAAFFSHQTARPAAPPYTNVSAARIVFAAPYTDEFYFVFGNPFPPGSDLTERVFVSTTYETNVVLG